MDAVLSSRLRSFVTPGWIRAAVARRDHGWKWAARNADSSVTRELMWGEPVDQRVWGSDIGWVNDE